MRQSETSRGRFSIIQGMFQVQSGLWADAISILSEGASIAQSGHDHLWHGKALEFLLLCMLFLTRSDSTFTIPQVCRSFPNRSSVFQSEKIPKPGDARKVLAQLMPPIVETILELYAKVSNLDLGGSLQDVLRESRVRLVNLLVYVKRAGGMLTRECVDQLVLGQRNSLGAKPQSQEEPVAVSKSGLANILIETLQASQSSNSVSHCTSLSVAVASSLSMLGLGRKHAFYLRLLMQQFVPRLIEARKVGASEVGIHPAAGHPPLSNPLQRVIPEMALGTRNMLDLAAAAYGAPLPSVPPPRDRIPADMDDVQDRLRIWATEHGSRDIPLKLDMLRICVSVCEALPDVPAGLHFTSHMLRGAKQVVTMPTQPGTALPLITAEEQARLVDSMKRAVSAASRLGAHGYRAEYWDDFLVRDVQVFEQDSFSKLRAHKPSDLSIRGSGLVETVRDPFIYNPFSKDKSVVAAPVLVAEELATFAVVLQNPLEIEVEIEELCLITQGCGFIPTLHSLMLGPFSTQIFTLNGKPTERGDLEVVGCRACIRSCYTQDFFVFREAWTLPSLPKQNAVGKVRFAASHITNEGEDSTKFSGPELNAPVPASLQLRVISSQPRLVFKSNTLEAPAIMLLEGESRVFQLDLINPGTSVAADFVLVTTEDSVTARLQDALSNKDLTAVELFEIQNQLAINPAIDMQTQGQWDSGDILAPGQSVSYRVTVSGRPGLVSASVQADYAFLGSPSSEVKGTFYTRQIRFPITVTVNGSVEIPRCNVLPINNDFVWNTHHHFNNHHTGEGGGTSRTANLSKLSRWLKTRADASDFCLMSLDLRNVWPQPLSIDIQARKPSSSSASDEQLWQQAFAVSETLQPGHVSRVILLIPRLFIKDPYAPIPNLETQKQFVVTTSKLSMEAETVNREYFWYREELLKCLRGTWTEESSGRHGEIDLRKGVRLSPRMVDVLKVDHADIEYDLRPIENASEDGEKDENTVVRQIGRSHFVLKAESFATLSVKIHNRTQDTLSLLLRLQPALRHQPHNIALDLSKRFAWSGVLQRALHPAIEPGGVCVAELGVIALAQGDYEINASVEEVKSRRTPAAAKRTDAVGSVTGTERRIWHARSPCLIDAISS